MTILYWVCYRVSDCNFWAKLLAAKAPLTLKVIITFIFLFLKTFGILNEEIFSCVKISMNQIL
jgi:hypothetical protein